MLWQWVHMKHKFHPLCMRWTLIRICPKRIDINTAHRTHVSCTVHDEVGSNKDVKTDAVMLGTNPAYGSHV